MLEPAKTVIEICGGYAETARLSGRALANVYRWTYPKGDRGGTGGTIPTAATKVLLENAHHLGLRPHHFFPPVEAAE